MVGYHRVVGTFAQKRQQVFNEVFMWMLTIGDPSLQPLVGNFHSPDQTYQLRSTTSYTKPSNPVTRTPYEACIMPLLAVWPWPIRPVDSMIINVTVSIQRGGGFAQQGAISGWLQIVTRGC